MCGIAGILNFNINKSVDKGLLKSMTDIIRYRGPDGEGFFEEKNVGLGHRRLSIIDLETGDQPMFSDDAQKVLVFNGELYNYIELREELKERGYQFRTNSDTEVVIKAYEEWDVECQNKFNGMWSFALWDKTKQELFLSRDRIGEKPLHYSVWNNSFVFGSEIKSLFAYGIPKKPLIEFAEVYLTLTNIPAPYTFYDGIMKLLPGHFIIVNREGFTERKYWDLPEIDEDNMLQNKREIYEQFEYLLSDSVKLRMRSDVPFGAFLSGGLDSSAIVSLMGDHSNLAINTFTIGFPEKNFDESKLAEIVSKKFNTNHHLGNVCKEDFNQIVEKLAFHYDEPFGDSSAIPTGYVSKYAREKVKMVLTGDGGDEVLSGYPSYQGVKFANYYKKLPLFVQKKAPLTVNKIARLFSGNLRYKLNRVESVFKTSSKPFNQRIIEKRAFVDYQAIRQLTKKVKHKINTEEIISEILKTNTYKDDFYKLMYLNFKHDLPNDYLVKVDRMSMAYSLETRLPFLDYRLIEFMVKVDKNIKMQGWERKSVLRHSIGRRLPKEILNAPKKGFSIPLREWFKDDDMTKETEFKTLYSFLDKEIINNIMIENKTSQRDNGVFIWSLLMLDKALD